MLEKYQSQKQEILNLLLDGKNTSRLSQKLGYAFDQVKRWQNGSKQLRWDEFCDLCSVLKVPLEKALSQSLGMVFQRKDETYRIMPHLKIFSQNQSAAALAKKFKISPSTMQRYLDVSIYPEFEFVLAILDQRPQFLEQFKFGLLSHLDFVEAPAKSFISLPWAAAVANAASLPQFRDLPQFATEQIAEFVGVTPTQVMQAIDLMLELEMIVKKDGQYVPTLPRTISATAATVERADFNRYIRYWMRRSEKRFEAANGTTVSTAPLNKNGTPNKDAFRIFAASPESIQKISDIIVKAEQEIHDLLQQDKSPKTDVRVLLLQHFSVQDHSK